MVRVIFFATFLCFSLSVEAQTIVGKWQTIDDETGKPKSIVEIIERNGKFYGKVIRLFRDPSEEQDPVCDKCPTDDDRHKKKIIGMEILRNLIKDDDGDILYLLDSNHRLIFFLYDLAR